jgi:hypothetical protein
LPTFHTHFTPFCQKQGFFNTNGGPKLNIHASALIRKAILHDLSPPRRAEQASGICGGVPAINQMQQALSTKAMLTN